MKARGWFGGLPVGRRVSVILMAAAMAGCATVEHDRVRDVRSDQLLHLGGQVAEQPLRRMQHVDEFAAVVAKLFAGFFKFLDFILG